MATSDEWSRVGYPGNPVTGDPGVIDGVTKELRGLSDLAGQVGGGLDALLTKAEDGGFEGRTADALRGYVKNELKTFMVNVARSFDLAASATARYSRALGDAQDRAENAADTVAALERVGGAPLAADDPELARSRNDVAAEIDGIQGEAKILEDALHEAARLVSRPIKPPKKSFWKKFVSAFWKALEILTLVLTLVAVVVSGPLGLVAFGLGAVLFVKALVDYAQGNGNALSLGLAFLGILFPSTKGLTTIGGLTRMAGAGARAFGSAASSAARMLFRAGRTLLAPRALLSLAGQGLLRGAGAFGRAGSRAFGGLAQLPRVFARAPGMLSSAARFATGFARGVWQQARFALRRDFFMSTAFVGGSTAKRLGVYTVVNTGRFFDFAVSAVLPLRYSELARFGYSGAFRLGILERGLARAPQTVAPLARTGSLAPDLAELTSRGLNSPRSAVPFGETAAGKLVVPGTAGWDDALDELSEIMVKPVTATDTRGVTSLPRITGSDTVRFPGRLDDLGVRMNGLDTVLDRAGLPVGPSRTGLDDLHALDGFGTPVAPGTTSVLLPPRTAVDRLTELDALTGLSRTDAGLLKPFDELTDLAPLSIDGKLGGLTEAQLGKVLDGELDLVRATPDGVVLRIGGTDPIDVHVRLKGEVRISVLGPADVQVQPFRSAAGGGQLDDLGMRLEDLARLIPRADDGVRGAGDLLGLGPVRAGLATDTAATRTPPLTLRDIVTGGATGKLAMDRFQAWTRAQTAELRLDTAGRELAELGELGDVPPLRRAEAELDLSAAQLQFNQARMDFDRLGTSLDAVRQDIVVMAARVNGPAAALPTGELRLLDDLGRPTGQSITIEPGPTVNWVLRTDSGVVPGVEVRMIDGGFSVTGLDGVVTRFGVDGRPVPSVGGLDALHGPTAVALPRLTDMPELGRVRLTADLTDGAHTVPADLARFDGMALSGSHELAGLHLKVTEIPAGDLAPASFRVDVVDVTDVGAVGGPVRLPDVGVTLREGGGLSFSGPQGGMRWQFDSLGRLEHRELPLSGSDFALRFTDDVLTPLPRVVGPDGVPVHGATLTPMRDASGALGGLTVRVPGLDGLASEWRFAAGGVLRQHEVPVILRGIDGPAGLGVRVTTTPGAGGLTTRVLELTGPSSLTGSFRLGPMESGLAGRLPNGFTVTDTITGSRFHFDEGGRLAVRDVPAPDGDGFLRFTEGATPDAMPHAVTGALPDAVPGTAPVRLDDLGGLPDGIAQGDMAQLFHRTLDEAGGVRVVPDGAHPSALADVRALELPTSELPLAHLDGLHRPTGSLSDESLSDLSGLSDLDLDAIRARLDEHREVVDQLNRVPLSGVDELAGVDLRWAPLPASDTVPPGTYRLELVEHAPGAAGVHASDFTVELVDNSGRFAVTDRAGTTRFTFDSDGRFAGRDTALAFDGLPEGLRLQVTHGPGVDAAGRVMVDVLGPSGATRSVQLAPAQGTLAGRLPGGFTLTDTVTGSRFHFDHTGRLALRDLPDQDGSFLRLTEGAASDTPPVRLGEDELDGLGSQLGEHLPPGLSPEHDGVDLARFFDRTLDEASGFRTPPAGASADLSGISGAMDFLHAAPDTHALQSLDLPGLQRLTAEATSSLDRLGLHPALLNDQLRQLTGQAQLVLRREGNRALQEYLDLPLATRLDDLRGDTGRVTGDFTITPTPHGDSRFTVTHNPSGLTLGFTANRELVHQDVFLRGGPAELDGLRLGMTGRAVDGGAWTPSSLDFAGTRPAGFTVAPNPRGGFTLTDTAGTASWHYGTDGVPALRDVRLPGDRGVLRFDADAPGRVPRVLDRAGAELPGVRTELLDDGRISLIPVGRAAQPMERTVFSRTGTLLEETVAVRVKGGRANGEFWRIDHAAGTAVRVDSTGTPLTGRFATAKVELSGTGQFRLTGEGKVNLFEREVLGDGNTLHVDMDRVGRARWTEFDRAGAKVRAGERIWDADRRTVHDTLSYRWMPVDVHDVRTYTKAIDGGLIRTEKTATGEWTWTRFDSKGAEVLSGTREWSWNHIGFRDTYLDPATGERAVAQQRGNMWPLNGYHGSRLYLEHPVLPGERPAGMRVDPELHSAVGPANKPIDVVEHLADGGTLHVVRLSDQRMPASLWQARTGLGRFDGFFGNLVTGRSMFTVSKWTEVAADGAEMTGVRLVSHGGGSWRDVDRFGRIVRESRKLENGNVVEVGRSLDDPKKWAPAPKWNGTSESYELPWLDTKSGVSGTRHVAADGAFEDVFTDAAGREVLAMRSQGADVREYLAENPARGLGRDDAAGVWVDKNDQMQITGRRDHWGGLHVEAHGNPRHRTWSWKATDADGTVTEGVRKQNRGSLYSRTWDDSFVDHDRLGAVIRERSATDDGTVWIDATRQGDHTWTWRRTNADGTVHSQGTREYQDLAKGRWSDRVGDDVVRQRNGGRVREFAYTLRETPAPAFTPARENGPGSLADLLSRSARHFEPSTTVTVDRRVWREYDMGKVLRRRDAVEGVPGRYRESESLWGQWREYQDDRLVAQRTIMGRVWATDAFGRWSAFDMAKLPEISSLPSVGGQVGLDGHRAWRLIGREVDFRGYTNEFRGVNREFRDPFHDIWTGVTDGASHSMSPWLHGLRKAATEFSTGFLIEFGTSMAVSAITADLGNTRFDPLQAFERALLNGAIGGTIRSGVNMAQDMTPLGKLKYGLTNLDQGQDLNRHPLASNDDWAGEWSSFENPSRWRSGAYAYVDGLAVSALTGFVNNAVNATVFGVGGDKRTGLEALEAGAWGMAGSLFTGVTSGLGRYTFHAASGSRIFHRGGPGELIWQAGESLTAGVLNYWINNRAAQILPTRPFPSTTATAASPPATTPTPPPATDSAQPAADTAAPSTEELS
ncbi:hypothetical protein [Streptomyces sp. SID13726]|uniref:hypothetical protein n=1 Tax=Streptomyces sp. SID13726 TaxID=2706058 RepID=UPI0013B9C593|nr:hypothetical protein [Streptomyces sp. SID13726]NEA98865.1 hypothetical protein [Streptomyces sp. SID13726]